MEFEDFEIEDSPPESPTSESEQHEDGPQPYLFEPLTPAAEPAAAAVAEAENWRMGKVSECCYRHMAYRNVVRWCWGHLGQQIRVVIPSCAVTRIRTEFPEESGTYTGFLLSLGFFQ
ncbi:hypothetical protein SKAU_G00210430 [Synaphobranchus kaupii]|uniref:P2X purinoreceptor 7 intracellular domain-containing protein n=1 Tax=Synaphobranchus kaupii TaxID=118154 RepID=A0A9Q1IUV4_SYNKA|nr:hypothetical protein SKAU_G00210430 [Synaphobranchus kaupii]